MKTGKILWYSERDRNGIIKDCLGNEFYFDISVVMDKQDKFSRGDSVFFHLNKKILDCSCATNVIKLGK